MRRSFPHSLIALRTSRGREIIALGMRDGDMPGTPPHAHHGGVSCAGNSARGFIPLSPPLGMGSSIGAGGRGSGVRDFGDAALRRAATGKGLAVASEEARGSSSGGSGGSSSEGEWNRRRRTGTDDAGENVPEGPGAYEGEATVTAYKARAPVLLYLCALLFSVATLAAIILLAVVQAHIYDPVQWVVLVSVSVPLGLFLLFLLASTPKEVLFTPYSVVLRTQRKSRWFGAVIPLHDVRDVKRLGPCDFRALAPWRAKGRLSGLAGGGVLIAASRPSRHVVFSPKDPVRFWDEQDSIRA